MSKDQLKRAFDAALADRERLYLALVEMCERVGPRWFFDQNWVEPLKAIAKAEGR